MNGDPRCDGGCNTIYYYIYLCIVFLYLSFRAADSNKETLYNVYIRLMYTAVDHYLSLIYIKCFNTLKAQVLSKYGIIFILQKV